MMRIACRCKHMCIMQALFANYLFASKNYSQLHAGAVAASTRLSSLVASIGCIKSKSGRVRHQFGNSTPSLSSQWQ